MTQQVVDFITRNIDCFPGRNFHVGRADQYWRVDGLSADQLLISSYFNLPTPRSPDAEEKLSKMAEKVGDRDNIEAAVDYEDDAASEIEGGRLLAVRPLEDDIPFEPCVYVPHLLVELQGVDRL